jgi:hypothetical protein
VRRNKFWNDHIANQCSNTPLALGEEVGQLGLGGFGKVTRVAFLATAPSVLRVALNSPFTLNKEHSLVQLASLVCR